MLRPKKLFSLYKRPIKLKDGSSKSIYYVQYRDVFGNFKSGISTGATNKGLAEIWAKEHLAESCDYSPAECITFEMFTKDFFKPGSKYLDYTKALGKKLTKAYVDQNQRNLNNHLLPFFGKMLMKMISSMYVTEWITTLSKQSVSPNIINYSIRTLSKIFKYAKETGIVKDNPVSGLSRPAPRHKERGILTIEQVRNLLNEDTINQVWGGDIVQYAINLLACCTGLREGEILALQRKNVFDSYIEIDHSYSIVDKLKEPKCKSYRAVPIPSKVIKYLNTVMDLSPFKDDTDFIFHSDRRDKPIKPDAVRDNLYHALEKIGVTEEERKAKNIKFHSHRHFFNTSARTRIPDALLRKLTGHKNSEMTERYSHIDLKDFKEIIEFQEKIL